MTKIISDIIKEPEKKMSDWLTEGVTFDQNKRKQQTQKNNPDPSHDI